MNCPVLIISLQYYYLSQVALQVRYSPSSNMITLVTTECIIAYMEEF